MTIPLNTLLIMTLLKTLISVTLIIKDFTLNWFYLWMTLLLTVNEKLASWIAGEEARAMFAYM